MTNINQRDLAIYLHWPYCLSKCNYCAFNSIACSTPNQENWHQSIIQELIFEHARLHDRKVSSIYFGGGTPSLIKPEIIFDIISFIKNHWTFSNPKIEITLEVNPATITKGLLLNYLQAGINRLSIGIQSFNDKMLTFLGRQHTMKQAIETFFLARQVGFQNINTDIIFATPHQTIADLKNDLHQLINLNPDHVSAYQLSIEKGTPFGRAHNLGQLKMPNEAHTIKQFKIIDDSLSNAGFNHYEISNFAKTNCQSRHNIAYWFYHEYLGVGAGAHSRLKLDNQIFEVKRFNNIHKWQKSCPIAFHQSPLAKQDILLEMVIMGLRTSFGLNLNTLEANIGEELFRKFITSNNLNRLLSQKFLAKQREHLIIPHRHYLKTDAIINEITDCL